MNDVVSEVIARFREPIPAPAIIAARIFLSRYTVLMALPGVPGVRLDGFLSDDSTGGSDGPVSFDRSRRRNSRLTPRVSFRA